MRKHVKINGRIGTLVGVGAAIGVVGLMWLYARSSMSAPDRAAAEALDDPSVVQACHAERLPADVVDAWRRAGARIGWMGPDRWGVALFREGGQGRDGEVPAFSGWPTGDITQLPQPPIHSIGREPDVPSGLHLDSIFPVLPRNAVEHFLGFKRG